MFSKTINKLSHIICLLIICELLIHGLYTFNKGFLLTRDVINCTASCHDYRLSSKEEGTCPNSRSFSKVVILLIDALRYDFVTFNKSLSENDLKPYQNKMEIFQELISNEHSKSRLMKFVADPPTTTMQRIKGLTTGSLPTFVDASHNFASSRILEDNLVDQMLQNGMRIVALGDDTWGQLYPSKFHRSHFFPSFNVMDLDTVDDGILVHLWREIRSKDSDIILAHFLGVDHCGHRYGPDHPEMERKLRQMNDVIKNVSKVISDDDLLVVLGDHGMTLSGDHGGDSLEEVETSLFFYGRNFNFPPSSSALPQGAASFVAAGTVAQVDLVPTLSILLGIPIPCSNLGQVIEEVIPSSFSPQEALLMNFEQVHKYLTEYDRLRQEFPVDRWEQLKNLSLNLHKSNFKSVDEMRQYLTLSKMMCQEIWANFNIIDILTGLSSIFSVILIFVTFLSLNSTGNAFIHSFRYLFTFFLVVNTLHGILHYSQVAELNYLIGLLSLVFAISRLKIPRFEVSSAFFVVCVCVTSFSNSFVVQEDSVVAFVAVAFFTVVAFKCLLQSKLYTRPKPSAKIPVMSHREVVILVIFFLLLASVRTGSLFYKCREEKFWCKMSSFHTPLSSLPKEHHNMRFLVAFLSSLTLFGVPRLGLRRTGNLNGWEISVVLYKIIPVVIFILNCSFWALQCLSIVPDHIAKVMLYLPRVIYFVSIFGASVLFYYPLTLYVLTPSQSRSFSQSSKDLHHLPRLFSILKESYENKNSSGGKKTTPPIVYGLATSISAPLVMFISYVFSSLFLVGGDGMAPAMMLLLVTGFLALSLLALFSCRTAQSTDDFFAPNCLSVTAWFLLSIHGFYSTGHQATFPTLNWHAAFVGFDGTGTYVLPAVLVVVNTFSSQIAFGLSLPLVVCLPFTVKFLFPFLLNEKLQQSDEESRGEFELVEESQRASRCFWLTSIMYLLLHSVKVLVTCISAFVLRRHLMVWKVFAPHFVFEAVGLVVTCCSVLVGLCFVSRLVSVVEVWSKKLR